MAAAFHTLSSSEMRRFLLDKGQRHTGVHRMTERVLHWRYCMNCGLLNLKNETTARALRSPCVWEE